MQDIKLDFYNKKMLNEYVDKKDRVLQQITVACRSWLSDFFLDDSFGVDYDNSWGNQQFIELFIKEQIIKIPDVESVNNISVQKEKSFDGRIQYIINVSITYNKDVIEISNLII